MSDDEEPPGDNITFLSFDNPRDKKKPRDKPSARQNRVEEAGIIPVLPRIEISAADLEGEISEGLERRDVAATNMRIAGAPFSEIARVLEYESPAAAKRAVLGALAQTHPVEDWETMRTLEIARAEQAFARSTAMANADYLVDKDHPGELIPNRDKIRWHAEARQDLAVHAMISGAKAPTRVEITPSEQEYEVLVQRMIEASGHEDVIEAEVLEIDDLPGEPDDLE